ncbi:hypothetical protein [Mucilaginibacter sp. L3T2-6]|uniref:hypothetical protein n=1 Tax=Mucilaginibacter sp. L3T2-6 TaxID=3062491 RepID=UPI00267507B9|nr:hypothetical protein [Mucilaginibacter sp. L3T2-6]MDO3643280.1 hypothetical protein [Mucilaginibacter sp. L3T2-6]MDV6215604.1 hypothetical protein [Mucilaginibacter sp. L3T2-6]
MSKLAIIKVLLAVTVCFQQMVPCLSLFISHKSFGHHHQTHVSHRPAHAGKAKQYSFTNAIHLKIWVIITKHRCQIPPVNLKLKDVSWMPLLTGVLLVVLLNMMLISARQWFRLNICYSVLKRSRYIVLGQLII